MDELEKYMKEHPDQVREVYVWDIFSEWGAGYSIIFFILIIMTFGLPSVLFINGAGLFEYTIAVAGIFMAWISFRVGMPVC